MKIIRSFAGFILILLASHAFAHGLTRKPMEIDEDRKIVFPDTQQYKTIVLDAHTHSIFSDGHVWPRIRIGEAQRDGLDAIAITEHLEWQPHLEDIPHPDRNRSYDEAVSAAEGSDLIVIPGSEITRGPPASHINAIFINDANKLVKVTPPDDPYDPRAYSMQVSEWPAQEAIKAANDQGAFLFWNHPYWPRDFPNGIPEIPEFHISNAKSVVARITSIRVNPRRRFTRHSPAEGRWRSRSSAVATRRTAPRSGSKRRSRAGRP